MKNFPKTDTVIYIHIYIYGASRIKINFADFQLSER